MLLPGFLYTLAGLILFFESHIFYETLGYIYGSFSDHFIKDGGLAFLSSGILLGLSHFIKNSRHSLQWAGLLFLNLHAVFHIWILFHHHGNHSIPLELGINILPPFFLSLFVLKNTRDGR
jgi:hypothetical protein